VPWPNFFIVGAAKAGTTSLYEYLSLHPEVYMPEWKEPHYFSTNPGRVQTEAEYLALFADAGNARAIGEASTGYLYDPVTPAWVARTVGIDVSIFIVLRNPVDTAFSLWGQMVRDGLEKLDFATAIATEGERVASLLAAPSQTVWPYKFAYTDRVRYSSQVQRYLSVFPRENVHVYLFEELFAPGATAAHFAAMCRALSIREFVPTSFDAHNRARNVRWPALRGLRANKRPAIRALGRLIPRRLKRAAYSAVDRLNETDRQPERLSIAQRMELWERVRTDIQPLETALGRSVEHLWSPDRVAP
jgi:hypothetical protein